ncbi:MAG: toxin-antitoxin system HicB family antitoxin [Bacteroidales bacterium]|nr:toxin-antitoxin system HicB family antitoxin [Bacteroidales bacterium]
MNKDINYYLSLPYTREIIQEPEGGWFVRIKELPGCMSQGDTQEEALRMINDAMLGWLEIELEDGESIPEPRDDEDFSGKFVLRVPKSMHRKLVETSFDEGVSLNQWLVSVVSEAMGRTGTRNGHFISKKENGQKEVYEWPGLAMDVRSVLQDVGLNNKVGELDELQFSYWLGQNIDTVDQSIKVDDFPRAIDQIDLIINILNEHHDKSPIIKVIIQHFTILIESIQRNHLMLHKTLQFEQNEQKISALITEVNSHLSIQNDPKTNRDGFELDHFRKYEYIFADIEREINE